MAQRNLSKTALATRLDALEGVDTTIDGRVDDLELALDTFTSTDLQYAALTPAIQAGATRAVSIQVKDINGDSVAAATTLLCQLFDNSMVPSLAAAFTMAETGNGSETTTTANPALVIQTSAAGVATLTITDVITNSGATIHLLVTPVGVFGRPELVSLAFA